LYTTVHRVANTGRGLNMGPVRMRIRDSSTSPLSGCER